MMLPAAGPSPGQTCGAVLVAAVLLQSVCVAVTFLYFTNELRQVGGGAGGGGGGNRGDSAPSLFIPWFWGQEKLPGDGSGAAGSWEGLGEQERRAGEECRSAGDQQSRRDGEQERWRAGDECRRDGEQERWRAGDQERRRARRGGEMESQERWRARRGGELESRRRAEPSPNKEPRSRCAAPPAELSLAAGVHAGDGAQGKSN